MTSLFIIGGYNNQPFNPKWTLLFRTSKKKSDSNIISTIEDCNKAIEIVPKLDFAFYMRGQIKKMINQIDYCLDLLQAKELGYPVETELLMGCGK
jgi:hypothetical protein